MKFDITKISKCNDLEEIIKHFKDNKTLSDQIINNVLMPFAEISWEIDKNGDQAISVIKLGLLNAFYNGVKAASGL